MSSRKRDDLTGYLFRVSERVPGGKWVHSSYDLYGRPRTYMTVGAARGIRGRMQGAAVRRGHDIEFRVERAPVTEWEVVNDD